MQRGASVAEARPKADGTQVKNEARSTATARQEVDRFNSCWAAEKNKRIDLSVELRMYGGGMGSFERQREARKEGEVKLTGKV